MGHSGPWGNGSPTDSGSVSPGSNPGGPADPDRTHGRRSREEGRTLEIPAARVSFREEDRRRVAEMVADALSAGSLTLGPYTSRFEEAFAARHGAAHAVAVSSGTAALEILLRSLSVEGREVIVPANTFYATAGAVVHAGGTPVFADVSAATFALSAESVATALGPDTAAVILVHIGGIVTGEVHAIRDLCEERGVALL